MQTTYETPTTSPTLLHLLILPGSDEAWAQFVERYGPLVDRRCRAARLQAADAEDIRSAVFAHLLAAFRTFRHDPARRFRGYLQRVVDNAVASHWRTLGRRPGWVGAGGETCDDLPESLAGLGAELDERIRAQTQAMSRLIEGVRATVGTDAWEAFRLTAVEGLSGAEAAEALGKTPAAVFMAKSRVLARLRAAVEASRRE